MCGLSGLATFRPFADAERARVKLQAMTQAIVHRGPDAEGLWIDEGQGVMLGHRRLSILDLSPSGAQPMQSHCGRYIFAFNGEIYNHQALRKELEDVPLRSPWKGHSDTETLLAAIAVWGLEKALERAFGMFSFALWDRQKRVMSLARDRMGEKPLYFSQYGGGWIFGSELRALTAGGLAAQVDPAALAAYLQFGHVPDHLCILKGVRKVMPGSIVHLRQGTEPEQVRYDAIETLFGQPPVITDHDEAVTSLERVLGEVVSDQMISDVPLGCFLSGGVDSSLVASLMQAASDRQVQSFSIGFEDKRFNEAPHAAAVAEHLGTAHTEFILKEEDALAIVADMPLIYDEPFADSSQIPTTLLCRAARKHVTVALTGDGGDEVFGGYNRHVHGPRLWKQVTRLPWILRYAGASTVYSAAHLGLRSERVSRPAIAALGLPLTTLDNLPKLAAALRTAGNAEDFYKTFVSNGQSIEKTLVESLHQTPVDPRAIDPAELEITEWMMARDTTGYLPGDILVKVDRAAMSVGLETRAPFLDARISILARQMPVDLHVDSTKGKKILRALLDRHVPRALIERPKQGFAMPLDEWLRGALKGWGSELISDHGLIEKLGLSVSCVEQLWKRHQKKHINAGKELWTVLMLLLWGRGIVDQAHLSTSAET